MWHKQAAKLRQKSAVFTALIIACIAITPPPSAQAAVPAPRIKPAPPGLSSYISETDAQLFRKGLRSAKAYRWSDIEKTITQINDPVAKDTLRWIRAANDRNAPDETLSYVHHSLGNWPRMTTVRAKAEKRIFEKNWPARRVLDWFVGQWRQISSISMERESFDQRRTTKNLRTL